MASTIGTARGRTHGSWRPRALSSAASPVVVTVCCFCAMVATGLKATRKTMSSPLEMPPWTPPLRFVSGAHAIAFLDERVVVLGALEQRAREAGADLKPLARGKAEHGLGEIGLELVEDGLAEADRRVADDAGHHAAERIALCARLFNQRDDALGVGAVGPADDVAFNFGVGNLFERGRRR